MATAYPHLFEPLTLAGQELRNRICFPAVVSLLGREHRITPRWIDYYVERAKGGAAMLVTEGLSVHASSSPQPGVITLYDDRNDEDLRRAAEAVEQHDCRFVGQLWHVGRQALWNPVAAPLGVSDQPDALSWSVPHVMERDDIRMLIDAHADAAWRLRMAGFSGVELHGAHGYLIGQFLSPWSNTRADEYGGDIEGRTRFVRDIISAVRSRCGTDFIVGLKMPGDEGVPGGIDGDEALRIARRITRESAPDYIAFSQGNFTLSLENHVPDMHFPPAPFADLMRTLRAGLGGLPVMALGRIMDAAHAEQLLTDGVGDLIGMARALVADAALPAKAARGEARSVRPCVFSNVCWGEIHAGKSIACLHNPELATPGEAHWQPAPTPQRRRIAVAGAGVAGLQAAWVLAARGHEVTLFGSAQAGGKARWEAGLPGRAEVARIYEHQLSRAREHGVRLTLGTHANLNNLRALAPQTIVVATGACPRPPDTLRVGAEDAIPAWDLMQSLPPPGQRGGHAVFHDQDHTPAAYAAVDLLAQRFARVTLLTPRTQLGRPLPYVSLIGVYRRLYGARVDIVTAHTPVRWHANVLTVRNGFNRDERELRDVDLLVYATPRQANDTLAGTLRTAGLQVNLVGDCFAPRSMLAAIHEAHALALRL